MASGRSWFVGSASVFGSFVVYAAHVACGGTAMGVPRAPAQTSASSATTASPSSEATSAATVASAPGGACGCASAKTTASFAVSGDEKIALDPLDAQASLDVAYGRGAGGKRQVVLTGVVRAYRTDVAAERPTTFGIRVVLPEVDAAKGKEPKEPIADPPKAGGVSSIAKELAAYVTSWGAGSPVAPRVYATVAKSSLTYTVSDSVVEVRGSLTVKDVPSGRSLTLDKLTLRKTGTALLPERTGAFHQP